MSTLVRRLLLAATLIAGLSPVTAQQFKTIPSGTVIGRTQVGIGPAQAIPFSQLIALLLQSSLTIPTLNTNSIVFAGSTSGQATVQAQATAGTPSLLLPNTSGTIPSSATSPIVLNPVTGAISCPTCATSVSASTPIVASRAIAQTLNLSGLSALKTLGYTTPGDGGGATFQQVTGVPFRDTNINGFTIAGGSGYVNGTYNGVPFGGGNGLGCGGQVTVSGGAVTSIGFDVPCAGYAVGDVLTSPNSSLGGSGSGFSLTINSLTAAMASFTDAVGTTFEYVTDAGSFPNAKQFGCKLDYNGTDATATNDLPCYQSAMAWSSFPYASSSAAVNGTTFIIPKGASLICGGSFYIPQGVTVKGAGIGGTNLKECTAENAATNFIVLCSNLLVKGQFGCKIQDLKVTADGPANSTVAAIFSTGAQQFPLVDNVLIVPGLRTCITYGIGTGGASNAEFLNGDCESDGASTNPGIEILSSVGSTQVLFQNWVVECGACTNNKLGFAINGGFFVGENIQFEKIYQGIVINSPLPATIKNVADQATTTCNFVIQSSSVNPVGNTIMENISPDTCPTTFANGRTGGNITGYIGASVAK